jgi:hypothetical protein
MYSGVFVPLKLDGGNVVMNTKYVLCSEKVFRDNQEPIVGEIERLMATVFERRPIFVRTEKEDPTSHADGLLAFLHEEVLLVNDLSRLAPEIHAHNLSVLKNIKCEVVLLPYNPKGRKVRGWHPITGNYVNF